MAEYLSSVKSIDYPGDLSCQLDIKRDKSVGNIAKWPQQMKLWV